MLNLSPQPDGS